ncbi:MAG: hypothetical protein AVDCRST_MAG36-1130 [uncultured Nocardioidaceae bacterium]|uniref:DUF4190 domain-containing protein n=1 Tax=uncultured Nocardioidaceae bacterium TaxID=253824 RepID=A0A6J4LMR0_9ACTN|nr:MAG: hypothetical protein AVDCRST_MAG36-1130 [uncultured Nocardioidaceae bacterium]
MSTPHDPHEDPGPQDGPAPGQGQGYGQYGQQLGPPPGYGPQQGYGQSPGYYGPGAPGGPPAGQQTNGVAVASLVLGIVSVTLGWCCVLFALAGPAALVLGKQGQRRADQSGGRVGGRAMATAGFVLGILGTIVLLIGIAYIVYVLAQGDGFTYRFRSDPDGLDS